MTPCFVSVWDASQMIQILLKHQATRFNNKKQGPKTSSILKEDKPLRRESLKQPKEKKKSNCQCPVNGQ